MEKPNSRCRGSVSHIQLRCFIILYLSLLSVLGMPLMREIASAHNETVLSTHSGAFI